MAVQVGIRPLGEASVVSLGGAGDARLLARLAEAIVECTPADRLLIVEVDDLLVANLHTMRTFVRTLVDRLAGRPAAFCCRRMSGRRLRRRCGGDELPVFTHVEEAAATILARSAA